MTNGRQLGLVSLYNAALWFKRRRNERQVITITAYYEEQSHNSYSKIVDKKMPFLNRQEA